MKQPNNQSTLKPPPSNSKPPGTPRDTRPGSLHTNKVPKSPGAPSRDSRRASTSSLQIGEAKHLTPVTREVNLNADNLKIKISTLLTPDTVLPFIPKTIPREELQHYRISYQNYRRGFPTGATGEVTHVGGTVTTFPGILMNPNKAQLQRKKSRGAILAKLVSGRTTCRFDDHAPPLMPMRLRLRQSQRDLASMAAAANAHATVSLDADHINPAYRILAGTPDRNRAVVRQRSELLLIQDDTVSTDDDEEDMSLRKSQWAWIMILAANSELGWSVLEAVMIPYLTSSGVSEYVAGNVILVGPVISLFMMGYVGRKSDELGRRGPFLAAATVILVVAYIGIIMSDEVRKFLGMGFFVPYILLIFGIADSCNDLFLTTAHMLLSDMLEGTQLAQAQMQFGLWQTVFIVVAFCFCEIFPPDALKPQLAKFAAMVDIEKDEEDALTTIELIFFVAIFCVIGNGLLMAFLEEEGLDKEEDSEEEVDGVGNVNVVEQPRSDSAVWNFLRLFCPRRGNGLRPSSNGSYGSIQFGDMEIDSSSVYEESLTYKINNSLMAFNCFYSLFFMNLLVFQYYITTWKGLKFGFRGLLLFGISALCCNYYLHRLNKYFSLWTVYSGNVFVCSTLAMTFFFSPFAESEPWLLFYGIVLGIGYTISCTNPFMLTSKLVNTLPSDEAEGVIGRKVSNLTTGLPVAQCFVGSLSGPILSVIGRSIPIMFFIYGAFSFTIGLSVFYVSNHNIRKLLQEKDKGFNLLRHRRSVVGSGSV